MKTMKRMSRKTITLAAVTLLAAGGGAETVAYSSEIAVDTRSLSRVTAVDDTPLDSRSYTADWSEEGTLNTKRMFGSMIRFMYSSLQQVFDDFACEDQACDRGDKGDAAGRVCALGQLRVHVRDHCRC